jgi:hypothetical protein
MMYDRKRPENLAPPLTERVARMYAGKWLLALRFGDHDRMDQINFQAKQASAEKEDSDAHPSEFEHLADIDPQIAGIIQRWTGYETVYDLSTARRSEIANLKKLGPKSLALCDRALKDRGLSWMPEDEA